MTYKRDKFGPYTDQFTPAVQPDFGDSVTCLIDDQWAEGNFILELSVEPTTEIMDEGYGWYVEPGNYSKG